MCLVVLFPRPLRLDSNPATQYCGLAAVEYKGNHSNNANSQQQTRPGFPESRTGGTT